MCTNVLRSSGAIHLHLKPERSRELAAKRDLSEVRAKLLAVTRRSSNHPREAQRDTLPSVMSVRAFHVSFRVFLCFRAIQIVGRDARVSQRTVHRK